METMLSQPITDQPESSGYILNLEIWRRQLAWLLLRMGMVVGGLIIVMAIYRAYVEDFTWRIPLYLGLYGVLGTLVFRGRASYRVPMLVMIGAMGAFGAANLTQFGINAESSLVLLSAALLTSIFFWPLGRLGG